VSLVVRRTAEEWRFVIDDAGKGMEDTVRERAIEPFFTTKEPGRGMGLGLFLAHTVAQRVDGRLELVSQPGRGTTATLRLPVADAAIRRGETTQSTGRLQAPEDTNGVHGDSRQPAEHPGRR
jgi:two-component system sensor histidine kinase RegB